MGLRSALARWLLTSQRAVGSSAPVILPKSDFFGWSDWSIQDAVSKGYAAHVIVYRCIRLHANTASSVPWVVKTEGSKGPVKMEAHPAIDLLKSPNPLFTWREMIERIVTFLHLAGSDYDLVVSTGGTVQLWPLRPDRVTPKVTAPNEVSYVYDVKGAKTTYPAEQIAHFRMFDPGDDINGLPTLKAAMKQVDAGNTAQDAQKFGLENMIAPSGILSGTLTSEQYDKLKEQIEASRGPKKHRRVWLSSSLLRFQPTNLTPLEMDFIASTKLTNEQICTAFGVHPYLIGVESATYENQKSALMQLWEHEVIPMLILVREVLNKRVAPYFGEGVLFDFDLSEALPTLQKQSDRADLAQKYVALGISPRAVNERLGLGFEPEDVPEEKPQATPFATMSVRGKRVALDKAATWQSVEAERAKAARKMQNPVVARLKDERDKLTARVEQGELNTDNWVDATRRDWQELIVQGWRGAYETFAAYLAKQYGRAGAPVDETRVVEWGDAVAAYVRKTTAKHVTGIVHETKKEIRAEVLAGMEANESNRQIASRIKGVYDRWIDGDGELETTRAMTIAVTETHAASSFGMRAAAKDAGIFTEKEWISSRDDRVRDSHQDIDGERAPIDVEYSNGCMYPGDPEGDGEEIINCRCVEVYY